MALKNKRILVSGANGFVGKHLITRLIKENAEIYALDKSKNKIDNVNYYSVSLNDKKKINELIKRINPEIVFHLAAFPDKKPTAGVIEKTIETNIKGTVNLLEAVKEIKPIFIHIGSYKEYGGNKVPFREDMELKPISPYGISKASAEMFCMFYNKIFNLPVILLRFPTIYGPAQNPDSLIPYVIISCLKKKDIKTTGGKQKRELIYIGDVIEGLIKAASAKEAIGEIINLGTGRETEIKEIVIRITQLMGNPVNVSFTLPYKKNEIWRMVGSNEKAKDILNWGPSVSLEDGLKKTIEWYKKNDKRS